LSGSTSPTTHDEWNEEIDLAEKLLIYAHCPAANSSSLNKIPFECANIHILNWGQHRDLMPEVSRARWSHMYQDMKNYAPYGSHELETTEEDQQSFDIEVARDTA